MARALGPAERWLARKCPELPDGGRAFERAAFVASKEQWSAPPGRTGRVDGSSCNPILPELKLPHFTCYLRTERGSILGAGLPRSMSMLTGGVCF